MELTYYGHSCFALSTEGETLIFDPFISHNPLADHINVADIKADYILLSHGHADHIADAEQLAKQNDAIIIAQPEITSWFANKEGMKKTHQMNIGGKVEFGFGTVKMVNAIHSSSLPDGSYGGSAAGYVVKTKTHTIYFAGDTALTYDMKILGELYDIEFALFPVGDNFTMGIEDALIAADWVKAKHIIAMHYDTFPPVKIDRDRVSEIAKQTGRDLIFMEIGQTLSI